MLSISNVSNSSAASSYYEQADDYYSKDRSPSVWSGQAAAVLGLSGEVKAEDFRAMLDGKLPNGEEVHHAADGHRGGTDLTFSAPKSVSMQSLIGNDTRLLAAHETAVERALQYAESIAACRVTERGEVSKVITGNLAVAQFRHDLSRSADPQLHTHCVVLNVTQRADGQWRAVDNQSFYNNKMLTGAYYRSELAKEVQALGYGVRVTHGDGRFELSHIKPSQIEEFSSRSRMIEEALKAQGLRREDISAQKLQTVALQTRERKTDIDRAILQAEWQDRSRQAGLNFGHHREVRMPDAVRYAERAAEAVAYASAHLTEREAVVRNTDLMRAALERGTGQTDLAAIRLAIKNAVVRGELIQKAEQITTPAAQQREREILGMEAAGRNQTAPIMSREAVDSVLAATTLNAGQRDMVRQTLTTENRITGVQGMAGTGKTTALRVARVLAEDRDIKLVGVAPSASAARELSGSGIPSQTLAALAHSKYAGLDSKTLVVVDEAGMVSAKDMHALLAAVEKNQASVLLVGDTRQLKAVEAGKPFAQLQAAGMTTAHLDEIQRQKTPGLKEAVELAARGEVGASLAKLETRIVEIDYHRDRHQRMAADYAVLSSEARAKTLIVAGTNNNRQAINTEVRKAIGMAGKGETFTTLIRKDLSEAQSLRSVSYQPGDVVRADKNYKTLGMERGDMAHVVEGRPGVVTLKRADGARVEWHPVNQLNMSAYTEGQRELAAGDLVRFTENNHQQGIVNGERATVVSHDAEAHRLTVEKSDGTHQFLDSDKPLHLDYGYCQTVHSAQGQTCERVMIEVEASGTVGGESLYYVAISRAEHEVTIYTDDKGSLPEAMTRTDEKSAALDLPEQKAQTKEAEMSI